MVANSREETNVTNASPFCAGELEGRKLDCCDEMEKEQQTMASPTVKNTRSEISRPIFFFGGTSQQDEASATCRSSHEARQIRRDVSNELSARRSRREAERRLLSKLSANITLLTAENRRLAQTHAEMKLKVQNLRQQLKKALMVFSDLDGGQEEQLLEDYQGSSPNRGHSRKISY